MTTPTVTSVATAYDFLTANGFTPAVEALAACETRTTEQLALEYLDEWVIPSVDAANDAEVGAHDEDASVFDCPGVDECRAHIAAALDILADEIADDYGDN